MTSKLLALAKVCLVLGNVLDVSWHLSRRGSELEKRWIFSFLDKNGVHKNKACAKEGQAAATAADAGIQLTEEQMAKLSTKEDDSSGKSQEGGEMAFVAFARVFSGVVKPGKEVRYHCM